MKNVWKVSFDAKYTGLSDLQPESVTVIANGDGMAAVSKARRLLIGKTFEDGPIAGKWVIRKCRYVTLVGLALVDSIDA